MQTKTFIIYAILFTFIFTSCKIEQNSIVASNSDKIHYMGRIGQTDSVATFYWPGTSAKINFEGTSVKAILKDERGDNYYNVIIDNDSIYILHPESEKNAVTLAENLTPGKHSIELFKRTEYDRGATNFYGFELEKDGRILAPDPIRKKKIEFYGNSITAGYAIEDYSGNDSPDSIFTNNYLSYAARTARHFDAEYQCTAKGGIGIMISWFPTIMPEIYDRINPENENSKWDFSKFTPNVVVINLLQNDSWLVNKPKHESFKKYFGAEKPSEEYIIKAYQNFVASIRNKYPETQIICTLGAMDATQEGSLWPGYVKEAIRRMNDAKIFTYFMPYKNTPGHPKVEEQEIMAEGLIQFINKNIQW